MFTITGFILVIRGGLARSGVQTFGNHLRDALQSTFVLLISASGPLSGPLN